MPRRSRRPDDGCWRIGRIPWLRFRVAPLRALCRQSVWKGTGGWGSGGRGGNGDQVIGVTRLGCFSIRTRARISWVTSFHVLARSQPQRRCQLQAATWCRRLRHCWRRSVRGRCSNRFVRVRRELPRSSPGRRQSARRRRIARAVEKSDDRASRFRLGTPEHDHVYYCSKFSAGQVSLTDHGYVWRLEKRGCVAAFFLRS